MRIAFLLHIFICTFTTIGFSQDCSIDAGRDTLICGYSYTLSNDRPTANWSLNCSTAPGVVDFFSISEQLTSATVSACGAYDFVHEYLELDTTILIDSMIVDGTTVYDTLSLLDTLCLALDTIRVIFKNPSNTTFDLLTTTTIEFLEMDCPINDTINCGNLINAGNTRPDPLWTFTSVGVCNATIIEVVLGDTTDCEAEQISFSSTSTIGTVTDTFTIYQSEFLVQDPLTGEILVNNYGEVLGQVNNSIFESVSDQCPLPESCAISMPYCLDTVPDTTMTILPIRLSGQWFLSLENTELELSDTTNFILEDSAYFMIAQPSPYLYEANFQFFQINYMGDTIPSINLGNLNLQWQEEWRMDTTISIDMSIIDTCCGAPVRVNREALNTTTVPVYDCPPISIVFLEELSTALHIPVCDSGFYQVQVSIQGGRPPYQVEGLQGVLNGSIFLSDPIPIDDNYQLNVSDQDGCTKIIAGDACPCIGLDVNTVAEAGLFCGAPCTPLIGSANVSAADSLVLIWSEASGSLVGFGDSVTVCDTGLYLFSARDPISGCEAQSSTRVNERELIADPGPDTILNCYSPTIQLGGPDLSYGFDISYEWSGPGIDSTNSHLLRPVIDDPGLYSLVVLFEEYACGDSNTVNIAADFNYPFADAGEDKSLTCNSGQVIYLLGSGTLGDHIDYTWSGPGIHQANRNVQNPWINQPGTYQLTVTNLENGCFARDTAKVFPFVPLSFTAEVLANSCWNFPEGIIQFNNVSGGSAPYFYSLNGQAFRIDNPLTNVPSGTWPVVIRDANGCIAEPQEVTIGLIPQLNLNLEEVYSYCEEGEVTIDATITDYDGELSYLWSNGATASINTYVGEPGDQWVEVTNYCETIIREFTIIDDSDVAFNIQENLAMPNAFSPDGDDNNETFGPILGELELINYQFVIFNRWGQKVFESDEPEIAWDGRVNGKEAPIDVYVWKLNARTVICDGFEEDIIMKGEVTILR